jgi:hypothetical protein
MSEHELWQVAKIERPERRAYFRWYCQCGVVGGKRPNEAEARADHVRHAEESSQ